MTMYGWPCCSPLSCTRTMFVSCSAAMVTASRSKRSRARSSACSNKSLIATSSGSRGCWQRNTRPIPPDPSSRMTL